MLSVVTLSIVRFIVYVEWHYTKCRNAEWRYIGNRYAECRLRLVALC